MKTKLITRTIFTLALLFSAILTNAQKPYDARINEKEILTPVPGTEPKINGPKIYGVRPGRKFVFRIPTQGERPISFKVNNLPKGLHLDNKNGVLSGNAPSKKGEYTMVFEAKNKHGKNKREFKLVVGDKIALTPPTGWNTWGGHMLKVSDELMRKTADIFVNKGLADVGFQYISIDDCWMKIGPEVLEGFNDKQKDKYEGFDYTGIKGETRNADGDVIPNAHFPSMKSMTDYIHSKGLKAGIYSGPGEQTCQKFVASLGHEEQDAKQYAEWGFDLLKYDLCSGGTQLRQRQKENPHYTQKDFWKPMTQYIKNQDRDILFNLCQYGQEEPWKWAPDIDVQSWRTGGDLNHHVDTYFEQALRLATELRDYSGPGHWNDPDFLYIHKIRDHTKMANPTKEIPLNTNQRYQYVTLWSIINAPFFFSCNIDEMDEFTTKLLTNADVLNINQDELGYIGEVVINEDGKVLIVKKLEDGSKAIAIFNQKDTEETFRIDWNDFDSCCAYSIYDVWRQKDLGIYKGGIDVQLSGNGVAYFRIRQE